jgi:hypothetical protein
VSTELTKGEFSNLTERIMNTENKVETTVEQTSPEAKTTEAKPMFRVKVKSHIKAGMQRQGCVG